MRSVPLDLGEVWAIPLVLRIALIENLRRLAGRVARASMSEQAADDWADRLLLAAQDSPEKLAEGLRALSRAAASQRPSFYLRLLTRMQDQDERVHPILEWVDQRVVATGQSLEAYVAHLESDLAVNGHRVSYDGSLAVATGFYAAKRLKTGSDRGCVALFLQRVVDGTVAQEPGEFRARRSAATVAARSSGLM